MKSSTMPPWVLHFLVNVVGRCCKVILAYIEVLQKERKEEERKRKATILG